MAVVMAGGLLTGTHGATSMCVLVFLAAAPVAIVCGETVLLVASLRLVLLVVPLEMADVVVGLESGLAAVTLKGAAVLLDGILVQVDLASFVLEKAVVHALVDSIHLAILVEQLRMGAAAVVNVLLWFVLQTLVAAVEYLDSAVALVEVTAVHLTVVSLHLERVAAVIVLSVVGFAAINLAEAAGSLELVKV